jgi:FdhE protein
MTVNASEERILQQLRLARDKMPDWAPVLDPQIALLEAQMAVEIPPVEVKLSGFEATERRRQGLPLVTGRELALDWPLFAGLFTQVCGVSAKDRPDLAESLAEMAAVPEENPEQLQAWVAQFMAECALGDDVDPSGLITFALTHTLKPFLRRYAEAYASLVDERGWKRNYCPVCGGQPDMASLGSSHHRPGPTEEEGTRYLLCSRCDNEWSYTRLGCPFCEEKDHDKIHYFQEEKDPHRLYVCDSCQRYLKTIELGSGARVLLPVERILTAGMDLSAREAGYH